jgi:hypothetical protein
MADQRTAEQIAEDGRRAWEEIQASKAPARAAKAARRAASAAAPAMPAMLATRRCEVCGCAGAAWRSIGSMYACSRHADEA